MDNLLNMVANGKLNDFKDRLKQAISTKLDLSKKELRQQVGKEYSSQPSTD